MEDMIRMLKKKTIELLTCEECEVYSNLSEKRNCFICGKFMSKKEYTKDELIDFGFECPQCEIQFDYDEYSKPIYYNNGQSQAVMCKSCWDGKEPISWRI